MLIDSYYRNLKSYPAVSSSLSRLYYRIKALQGFWQLNRSNRLFPSRYPLRKDLSLGSPLSVQRLWRFIVVSTQKVGANPSFLIIFHYLSPYCHCFPFRANKIWLSGLLAEKVLGKPTVYRVHPFLLFVAETQINYLLKNIELSKVFVSNTISDLLDNMQNIVHNAEFLGVIKQCNKTEF